LPDASLHNVAVLFYSAKRGQTAAADGLRQMFWGTPIRSICIHPPWLKDISPLDSEWSSASARNKGDQATNRDIVEAILFAITPPRNITIASMLIDSDLEGMDFRGHLIS
jgi:NADP-dependent 3-hydroxy acid dehydrogenase YdfG